MIVVARDGEGGVDATAECLDSIYAHTHRSFEVVLVSNGARGEAGAGVGALAARWQARHGNLTYLRNADDAGYARACNQGLAAARGDYLAVMHNDVVVTPGWLGRLMAVMAIHPSVALVGPALSSGPGAQAVGMRTYQSTSQLPEFAEHWAANHTAEIAVVTPIAGVCMLMRRQVVRRLGGFDGAFGDGIHADDDYCVRAYRAGFRMAVAFDAFVHHRGAATFKQLGIDRKRAAAAAWAVFRDKWSVVEGTARDAAICALIQAAPFDPARDHVPLADDGEDAAAAPVADRAARADSDPIAQLHSFG